jgi:hypothetical protein
LLQWINARKEGKEGLAKVGADELVAWVIESTHKDDDHVPLNEEAKEFLEEGDRMIYKNKAIDAGLIFNISRPPLHLAFREFLRRTHCGYAMCSHARC